MPKRSAGWPPAPRDSAPAATWVHPQLPSRRRSLRREASRCHGSRWGRDGVAMGSRWGRDEVAHGARRARSAPPCRAHPCVRSLHELAIRPAHLLCAFRGPPMTTHSLLLLPGDGIGPEVMAEVERLVAFFNRQGRVQFRVESALVGGAAIDKHGTPLTDEALAKAQAADAVVFGAVGGPKWDKVPYAVRPEAGLLRLRKELDLFANLRPAISYAALVEASTLRREHVEGLDILILRELTGGTYFGEPKEIVTLENGEKRAVDTTVYTTREIERIARVAFDLARKRRNKVHSAEKRNVMKTGVLWNEVVTALHAREAKDQELQHILADACAMQLVRNPKQFDVIVCDNLCGDMLSDEAAILAASIGMLASG